MISITVYYSLYNTTHAMQRGIAGIIYYLILLFSYMYSMLSSLVFYIILYYGLFTRVFDFHTPFLTAVPYWCCYFYSEKKLNIEHFKNLDSSQPIKAALG